MKSYVYIIIIAEAVMSLLAFLLMGIDKGKAKRGKRRIPEKTLFLFAALLGGVGGTAGMFVFHHKTKHWYFKLFFPLLALLQLALTVYAAIT